MKNKRSHLDVQNSVYKTTIIQIIYETDIYNKAGTQSLKYAKLKRCVH